MLERIPLKNGGEALIDQEDALLVSNYRWHWEKDGNKKYVFTSAGPKGQKKKTSLHRLILNVGPGRVVDHKNGDGLDNRRSNLRECSIAQNTRNAPSIKGSSSKFKGVTRLKYGKWQSSIKADGKSYYLGVFSSEMEAAAAYDSAARNLHKEYAYLNFPESVKP